jgi:hypothetical protein
MMLIGLDMGQRRNRTKACCGKLYVWNGLLSKNDDGHSLLLELVAIKIFLID